MSLARTTPNPNPRKNILMLKLSSLAVALTAIALVQSAQAEIFNAAEIAEMRAFYTAHGIVTRHTPALAQGTAGTADPSARLAEIGLTCADGLSPAGLVIVRFEPK